MRAYTASDIEKIFEQQRPLATHYIVAHTTFRPSNCTQAQLERFHTKTSKAVRLTLNCLSDMVNPGHASRAQRKPDLFRPSSLSTIEFLNPNVLQHQTVHVNVCLGNISKEFTTEHIGRIFRHCWVNEARQHDNVLIQELQSGHTAFDYIIKEVKRNPAKAMDCFGPVCWRRPKIDPPCRLKIDPVQIADFSLSNCG